MMSPEQPGVPGPRKLLPAVAGLPLTWEGRLRAAKGSLPAVLQRLQALTLLLAVSAQEEEYWKKELDFPWICSLSTGK